MNPKTPRVLIVDDQPANIHILAEALGGEYELLVATSASRALELAPGVDLVLLDVMMPDMSGLEVCGRLRNDPATRKIPVIFVTALEQTEDETLGFEAGGVDYIVKPIRPAIVRARVRTHLELKAARDLLERLATCDSLTGVANRRRFDDALREEWRRAARSARPMTLAIADIDHFKSLNDRFGHLVGDEYLVAVAQSLDRLCRRPGELVARYGGEEFAIMLPEVDEEDAKRHLLRALETVAEIEVGDQPPLVTISIGAVTVLPTGPTTIEEALRAADEALYAAKRNGRGRGMLRPKEGGEYVEALPQAKRLDLPGEAI